MTARERRAYRLECEEDRRLMAAASQFDEDQPIEDDDQDDPEDDDENGEPLKDLDGGYYFPPDNGDAPHVPADLI